MPFTMNLWRIQDDHLLGIDESDLDTEERLEKWIERDPTILGIDILLIGRQVKAGSGGVIDLLGMNPSGDIVVLELKKDKTPRDVVAQVLDYASWVSGLDYSDIDSIATHYRSKPLSDLFFDHYGFSIPESVNADHNLVIVAAKLDESSERIVAYLVNEHDVAINAVFFTYFRSDKDEYLGRAWLFDPSERQERSDVRKKSPWSGFWFVNVGEGEHRNWDDNREYGFIGAGQGSKYSKPLKNLQIGADIFAYMKGLGYVGYGKVVQEAMMVKDFVVQSSGEKLLNSRLQAPNASRNAEDPVLSEWVVGINWIKAYQREDARTFKGVFANQNIVCKLRHSPTLEFLFREFNIEEP